MAKIRRRRGSLVRKQSRMGQAVCKVASVVVVAVIAALLYARASTIVTKKRDAIKKAEQGLEKLTADLKREQVKWNEMTSVAKFDRALVSHGIAMSHATSRQIVYMDKSGRPREGVAVKLARERNAKMRKVARR